MTFGICRVCRDVGVTINADCGHEVHLGCCHVSGHEDDPLIVCTFCWHEPQVALTRPKANAAGADRKRKVGAL